VIDDDGMGMTRNLGKAEEIDGQQYINQNDSGSDVYELFDVIWKEKLTVFLFVIVSLLVGGGFAYSTTPVYELKIPYTVNVPGVNVNLFLTDGGVINRKKGNHKKGEIVFFISNREEVVGINQQLQQTNARITMDVMKKAKVENDYLLNGLPEEFRRGEIIIKNYLDNKRMLDLLGSEGVQVLTLGKSMVTIKTPKTKLTLIVWFLLGLMISAFYIFLKQK
jgi:capsular polysaccharide biosynthesis protein